MTREDQLAEAFKDVAASTEQTETQTEETQAETTDKPENEEEIESTTDAEETEKVESETGEAEETEKTEADTEPESEAEQKIDLDKYIEKEEYEKLKQDLEVIESNPILKALLEQQKSGRNVDHDFIQKAYKSYDQFKPKENINHAARLVLDSYLEEGYSEEEAKLKMEHQYEALFDEDESKDEESKAYRLQKIELERQASKFLEAKKKDLEDFRNLKPNSQLKRAEDYDKDLVTQREDHLKKMEVVADKIVKKFDKFEFAVGDETLEFEITKDIRKELKKDIVEYDVLLQRMFNPQGKDAAEVEKTVMETMLWLNPKTRPQMINAALSHNGAKSNKEFVKDKLKNANTKTNVTVPSNTKLPDSGNPRLDQMAEGFRQLQGT